ncbi:TPA: hypothetical protein ACNRQ0_005875, partial [Klebsiella pneumoniae]
LDGSHHFKGKLSPSQSPGLKIFTGIQPAKTLSCGFLLRPFSFCFPRLRLSHGTGQAAHNPKLLENTL